MDRDSDNYLQRFKQALVELTPEKEDPKIMSKVRRIVELLAMIEDEPANLIPEMVLTRATSELPNVTDAIEFLQKSYDSSNGWLNSTRKPVKYERNEDNLNKHLKAVTYAETAIYIKITPILVHQSHFRIQRSVGQRIRFRRAETLAPDTVVWKYIPLSYFAKSLRNRGIWFSSLQKLCQWNKAKGIADIREGEMPHEVKRIRDKCSKFQDQKLSSHLVEFPFCDGKINVHESIDAWADRDCNFACSWVVKKSEQNLMWHNYADEGRGVAIKSTIGALTETRWRLPVPLSFDLYDEASVRPISYYEESHTKITKIEDVHVSFLKRDEFIGESEMRLLITAKKCPAVSGFLLHTDLTKIIDQVIVGPQANYQEVKEVLSSCRFPVDRLRESILRPRPQPKLT